MKRVNIVLLIFGLSVCSEFYAQKECDIKSYFANSTIFRLDSMYHDVEIDQKHFVIKVLSDRMNENMEPYGEQVDRWENYAPKTIVIYDAQTSEIVFARKYDYSIPEFEKINGDLSKSGQLFLRWFSSGGGSGYSLDSYTVHYKEGKIVIEELFHTNELSFIFHHKSDAEIYVLQGIWDMTEDAETGYMETHFDQHRFEVVVFRLEHGVYMHESLGITTNKYDAFDVEGGGRRLIEVIKLREKLLPEQLNLSELIER